MSERDDKGKSKDLSDAVRVRKERRERWESDGERSIWQNISMIGSLGFLVIVPPLLGVVAGRYLDNWLGHGLLWTSLLIFLGVVAGCCLAWQKVKEE